MIRTNFIFQHIQDFIKVNDFVSIKHILQWEYQKDKLFDLKNNDGLTLVHVACLEGNIPCVEVLLRNGASAHAKSSVGWTALHAATLGGKIDLVSYLLTECSSDPLAKDDMNCLAIDLTGNPEILNLLKKYTEFSKMKKQVEATTSHKEREKKRRSYSCVEKNMVQVATERTQSMICTQAEAEKFRGRYNNAHSLKQVAVQLDLSLKIQHVKTNLLKNKSLPLDLNIGLSRNRITPVIQSWAVVSSDASTSSSSRLVGFFTKDRDRRKQELQNRDSGVYDEESDGNDSKTLD